MKDTIKSYFFYSLLTLLAGFSFQASAQIKVFACEPEWKALAEVIGGEKVTAFSATTAFQDPHYIEAKPSLIAKVRNTDMIFCAGANLEESWLPLLLRQSDNSRIQLGKAGYFLAVDQVLAIEIPDVQETKSSHGHIHSAGNPHVHLDPYRLIEIGNAFFKRLEYIDRNNSSYYRSRFEAFKQEWQQLIARWEKLGEKLKNKKAIVYHKNWSYLANWLNIQVIGEIESKPGVPPTSSHMAQLLSLVKEQKPDFILVTTYQDDKGPQWLSQKSSVPVVHLPFTVGGNKVATDLPKLYESIISLLLKQLND